MRANLLGGIRRGSEKGHDWLDDSKGHDDAAQVRMGSSSLWYTQNNSQDSGQGLLQGLSSIILHYSFPLQVAIYSMQSISLLS